MGCAENDFVDWRDLTFDELAVGLATRDGGRRVAMKVDSVRGQQGAFIM